jgi:hypothetical protein
VAEGDHLELLREAMTLEASGQRQLLAGEDAAAAPLLRAAADAYRASWEQAQVSARRRGMAAEPSSAVMPRAAR